jgi:hypothetical protein
LFSPGGSCNCLVSISPWKVGNSVLNTALCPMKSALGSTTCPALGGWLFALPPLSVFVPLTSMLGPASGSAGRLDCHRTLALSLCCFIRSLSIHCLSHPHSPEQVQRSTPTSAAMLEYSSLFMLSSFVAGGAVCPGATLDYVPRGWLGESHVVHDAYLLLLQIHTSSFETSW